MKIIRLIGYILFSVLLSCLIIFLILRYTDLGEQNDPNRINKNDKFELSQDIEIVWETNNESLLIEDYFWGYHYYSGSAVFFTEITPPSNFMEFSSLFYNIGDVPLEIYDISITFYNNDKVISGISYDNYNSRLLSKFEYIVMPDESLPASNFGAHFRLETAVGEIDKILVSIETVEADSTVLCVSNHLSTDLIKSITVEIDEEKNYIVKGKILSEKVIKESGSAKYRVFVSFYDEKKQFLGFDTGYIEDGQFKAIWLFDNYFDKTTQAVSHQIHFIEEWNEVDNCP